MRDKTVRQNLLSASFSLAAASVFVKAIGLIYKIPLSYMLSDEGMGYFNSAYAIYVMFYLLGTSGIPKAVAIIVSGDREKLWDGESVLFVGLRIFFIIGAALTVLCFIISGWLSSAIGTKGAALSVRVLSPALLFVSLSGVLRGYYIGRMNFIYIAVSEVISGIIKLLWGILGVRYAIGRGYSLEVCSAYGIMGITVGCFLGLLWLMIFIPRAKERINNNSIGRKAIASSIFQISLPITAASALTGVAGVVEVWLMHRGLEYSGYMNNVSNVIYGNYTTLALPIFSLVSTVVTPILTAALPSFASRGFGESNYKIKLRDTSDLITFICIPSFICMLFMPGEILGCLFDSSSAVLGAPYLRILSFSVPVFGIASLVNTALEGKGHVKTVFISIAGGTVLKILTTLMLIRFTTLGPLSIPIGSFASYFFSLIISLMFDPELSVCCIYYFISSVKYGISSLASLFAATAIVFYIQDCLSKRVEEIIYICLYGVFYLVIALLLPLLRNKRKKSSNNIQKNNA